MRKNLLAKVWAFGRAFQAHGTVHAKISGKKRFHRSGYSERKDAIALWMGRERQAGLNLLATLQLQEDAREP